MCVKGKVLVIFSSTKTTMSIRYLLIYMDKSKKEGGQLSFFASAQQDPHRNYSSPFFPSSNTCWRLEGIRAKRNNVQETRMSSVIFLSVSEIGS